VDGGEHRSDITPTIRGHQIFRMSIPADTLPPSKRDYYDDIPCSQQVFYYVASWQGRLCINFLILVFAIVITAWISTAAASCPETE
jgi:hypothetical protein